MARTKSFAFEMFDKLISSFFLFVILFSLLGIVLVAFGFPETYRFINPLTIFLASGILSCFFTVYFTRKELEKKWNRQQGVAQKQIS